MRKLVRLIVMWLLALALPIQGVSAATMLHCVSVHERMAAGVHGQAVHAHHHSHDDAAAHDAGGGADAHSGGTSHHHADKASCSACASCCSGVALPAMPLILAAQDIVQTVHPITSFAIAVFLTDGPERPPRIVLA
jgi:hypothetical protein